MFTNTKLDIPMEFLKAPFQNFMIKLPEGILHNYYEYGVTDLFVMFRDKSETEKQLNILAHCPDNDTFFHIPITLFGKNSIQQSLDDYFMLSKIEKDNQIKNVTEEFQNYAENPSFTEEQKQWFRDAIKNNPEEFNEKDEETHRRIFQFVLNTILYITSPDADTREILGGLSKSLRKKINKGDKKAIEHAKSVSGSNRYIVGGSITLSKEDLDLLKNSRKFKHTHRYPVGGHWRLQWYGSKENQYQKPMWIKPHFRGPETAELIKSIGQITLNKGGSTGQK
jgi:hypothetical protein